jgi:hypothetical protein
VTPALPGRGKPAFPTFRKQFLDLLNHPDAELTPILSENPDYLHRTTRVFRRGDWLSPGEPVEPGIPAVLAASTGQAGKDRRALASWMTDKRNPLTSRVLVNRLWEQLFGAGLVESLEDFGTQGIAPTHPELLDMLAWRFLHDDAWSVKKALKRIVMSETYRQRSESRPEGMEKDPRNRYHWRAPRVRLSAEQVRDQALQASGLLSGKMYGPSVMPYQPEGIWASPYNGMQWRLSKGEDRYRRALYTFWKRSSPYPSLMNFDGVSREVCTSRRIRTNTPLQALTLLNDSTYWDASVRLALRADSLVKGRPRDRIAHLYRRVAGREPAAEKVEVLEHLYRKTFDRLGRRPQEGERLLAGHACDPAARRGLAALAITANAILNLDEVVTRN